MRGVVRARLPEPFYFLVGVACLLSALAIYYFFVANGAWKLPQGNRPKVLERAQLDMKVWADKQTGFYYCAGTRLYGRTQSGQYISQGEALQAGYTAAMNKPCR
jgi:hypothetical protein